MPFEARGKLAVINQKAVKRMIVVGDIHGDLNAFNAVEELFNPSKDLLVFLGDYADRGKYGMEVIEGVKKLMEEYPAKVIALKGNHEDYSERGKPLFWPCTLIEEVKQKWGSWEKYFPRLKNFLNRLYLAALIPGYALFVHGGISRKIKSLKDLENPSREIEVDVLWSDPYEGEGEHANPRGAGVLFGYDVSEEIAKNLLIKYIIRSHEPRKALFAPAVEHNSKVITVSSTSVYGGKPFVLLLPLQKAVEVKEIEKYAVYL